MKVLGNINVDLDVVNKEYVDGEIDKINFEESFTKKEADKYYQPKGDYLTSIPKDYITTTDLDNKSDLKVKDTRNDDRDPLWYMKNYGSKQVFEFKYRKNVGNPPIEASASKNYTIVLTRVPWRDKSGGYPTQLSFGERIALRIGTSETTWGKWQTLATTDDTLYISKSVGSLMLELVKKAEKDHKHSITDIDNLQTALDSKAGVSHTHDEYLKKGDPIQLTSAQKAELKGERGAPGTPGKDGTSITTWTGTQAQYDRISNKSSTTLYIIKD